MLIIVAGWDALNARGKIDADSHIADVHSLSAVGEAIRRRPVNPAG